MLIRLKKEEEQSHAIFAFLEIEYEHYTNSQTFFRKAGFVN